MCCILKCTCVFYFLIKPQHIQSPTLFLKIFFNSYVLNRFHYKKYLYILSVFINRNSVILRF
ncbi:hypothetical protein AXE94_07280 [Staphylococcus aureus]|nr:hypothetical protein [Staphylococcus aureus]